MLPCESGSWLEARGSWRALHARGGRRAGRSRVMAPCIRTSTRAFAAGLRHSYARCANATHLASTHLCVVRDPLWQPHGTRLSPPDVWSCRYVHGTLSCFLSLQPAPCLPFWTFSQFGCVLVFRPVFSKSARTYRTVALAAPQSRVSESHSQRVSQATLTRSNK